MASNVQSRRQAFYEERRLNAARKGTLVKEVSDYRQYLYKGINYAFHRRLWSKINDLASCDGRLDRSQIGKIDIVDQGRAR